MSVKYTYYDNLTSKKLYDQWNEGKTITGYLKACLNLPYPSDHYEQIYNLCRRLARNLFNMQVNNHEKHYSYGRCKLLNYWLYEKVKEIIGTSSANNKKTMENLHREWNDYNKNNILFITEDQKCKPDTTILNFIDIEDKKLIYEHCLNYYEISKKSTNVDECKSYKEYIKDASLRYKEFESLFPEDKSNYATYYEKCKSYNPINISTYSNCPNEIKISEATEEESVPQGQSTLDGVGERKVREEGQVSEDEEREAGIRGVDVGGEREDQEKVESMRVAQYDLDPGAAIRSGPVHVDGQGDVGLTDSEPSASNSFVMPVGLSLFGIASFSSILYKFTPLRSVFNKLIHKNKNPMNHLHDIREELLEYMSTSDSKNRDNIPNYIAYHPT